MCPEFSHLSAFFPPSVCCSQYHSLPRCGQPTPNWCHFFLVLLIHWITDAVPCTFCWILALHSIHPYHFSWSHGWPGLLLLKLLFCVAHFSFICNIPVPVFVFVTGSYIAHSDLQIMFFLFSTQSSILSGIY